MISIWAGDTIDVKLLLLTVLSFIGMTMVVDSTIFGLGMNSIPDAERYQIDYYKSQAVGIIFCFIYVIANSLSKFFETIYGRLGLLSRGNQHQPNIPVLRCAYRLYWVHALDGQFNLYST